MQVLFSSCTTWAAGTCVDGRGSPTPGFLRSVIDRKLLEYFFRLGCMVNGEQTALFLAALAAVEYNV